MRLVFAGTPDTALPSLQALLDSSHEVAAVVTRPETTAGRGRRPISSPVALLAREHDLEVLTPKRAGEPEFLARLAELAPQVCPIVAYGALLPRAALDIPDLGWVNLHFSLLPAWRGAAPVQHALISGDDVTGASTFIVEPDLDTGPLIGTLTETIRPDDTAGTLLARLATAGAHLLVASLDALASGEALPLPQAAEGVSYAPKITVGDAQIRWQDPALAIDRRIRGCTPAPGAWTMFRGERVKVMPVERRIGAGDGPAGRAAGQTARPELRPGTIAATKQSVLVGTATHPLILGLVQPAGKKAMPASDWARGVRVRPDEGFHS